MREPIKQLVLFFCALAASGVAGGLIVSNQVLMVDQHGNLNVSGVASVANVASNAVAVQIASAASAAAEDTAEGVTNALQGVVQNIMEENVVVYRSGFIDAFDALVVFTDDDTVTISSFEVESKSSSAIVVNIGYVCTANIQGTKPIVYAHNTLTNLTDFTQVSDSNVAFNNSTNSVNGYTAGSVTINGQTYEGTYSIRVTIPNPSSTGSYFYWIKLSADGQSGDGATMDLANGVKGGMTTSATWGDKVLTFTGGVLTGVADAE